MFFPKKPFRANAGTIGGQILESPGTERSLVWSISVPFEPVLHGGEEVRPLLQCEGLVWPVARCADLGGRTLADARAPGRVEASFYVDDHADLALEVLELAARKRGGLELYLRGRVDFPAEDGTSRPWPIEVEVPLALEGVRVVPAGLRKGPRTAEDAVALLAQFIAPADFLEPEWDGACFSFRAKAERAADC